MAKEGEDTPLSPLANHNHQAHQENHSFGYFAEFATADDFGEFRELVHSAMRKLGFEHYSMSWYGAPDADPSALSTFPAAQWGTYREYGFYEYDLTPQYARENERPIFQSVIHDYVLNAPFNLGITKTMKSIQALSNCYGFFDYYHCLVPSRSGKGNLMVSISQRGIEPLAFKRNVQERAATLRLIADAVDHTATVRFADEVLGEGLNSKPVRLSPRPLMVLSTLANNDYSIGQMADELSLSVVTVNKHLETARKAFGVKSNHAAIRAAIKKKLISYDP